MMYVYIGIGLIAVAAIVAGIWTWALRKKSHKIQEEEKKLHSLEKTVKDLQVDAENSYKRHLEELDNSVNKKIKDIEELEETIRIKKEDLNELNDRVKEGGDNYVNIQEQVNKGNEEVKELMQRKGVLVQELDALSAEIKKVEAQVKGIGVELEDLKERRRLALFESEGNSEELWDLELSPRDERLIEVLKAIENEYAEFREELATIEWRKIWLPKIQELVGEKIQGTQSGIYMLVLKSDKNVRYVGQAVDIKTRWYEHVKKMLGVDAKGKEKLYRHRPEEFLWGIVELNPKDLDAAERYWIEYYGCKEKGLNKK